jgi:GDPmannose 4,6-dehydratase
LHLFNHDSERRDSTYFLPKLMEALRGSLNDRRHRVELNTLNFYCDWGSAREYMDIAVDIAERVSGEDIIVATGKAWKASLLAEELFKRHGLDYRSHLIERTPAGQPSRRYEVSTEKLRRLIGRVPKVGALELSEAIFAACEL